MKDNVFIIRETVWESIAKSCVTFSMLAFCTGVGWFIGNSGMSIFGGAVWIMWVLIKTHKEASFYKVKTYSEARAILDRLERAEKSGSSQ